jgi:hypothetical protein
MYTVRSPIVLSYQQEALKIQIGRCYACGDRILKKLCFFFPSFLLKYMAPVIFYWVHIPDVRENECHDVFSLYIKLFDAKVDASCSMEPCGNLLAACLEFNWFLVVCFVCQFVYRGTPSVVWRTQNNRIAIF